MKDIDPILLVEEAKKGNRQALKILIESHQNEVFRFLTFLSGNQDLAGDLTQETFIRALEGINGLKDNTKFKSWLKITAKNLFLDHLKSANVKYNQSMESLNAEEGLLSGLEMHPDLDLAIRQTLAQMTDEARLVLLLIDLEGHSYQEAAEIINITENALRSRLHRARQDFQDIYSQYETNPKPPSSFQQEEQDNVRVEGGAGDKDDREED